MRNTIFNTEQHHLARTSRGLQTLLLMVVLGLAGCSAQPPADEATPAATNPPLIITATGDNAPTPAPTLPPTEVPRNYGIYRHATGVFTVTIPNDWEALDASSEQRLLVRYIPAKGYGSRVTIDVTNEGPLPPEEINALAESYVQLNYRGRNSDYTEINRSQLRDGRLQYVFSYDDGRGARGRETLYIEQVGPYYAALRVFLAEKDTFYLSQALETITASFTIDAQAGWGSTIAAVNPAELPVRNELLWRDNDGILYFTGEVYNASPGAVTNVQMRLALCSETGIVQTEVSESLPLDVIPPAGTSPFGYTFEELEEDVTICASQVTAEPARPDPMRTTELSIDVAAGRNPSGNTTISGTITNPGLAPVTDVEVLLTVFDAEGRVVGFTQVLYGEDVSFAPGQSRELDAAFPAVAGLPERFVVLVQGRIQPQVEHSLAPEN